MRKLITLLAATTLMASPFVLAETQGNQNDVLQQIPAHQANGNANDPITVADAGTAGAQVAPTPEHNNIAPVKKKHKHHGYCKKHHHKCSKHKHHKAKKVANEDAAPENMNGPAPTETPAS